MYDEHRAVNLYLCNLFFITTIHNSLSLLRRQEWVYEVANVRYIPLPRHASHATPSQAKGIISSSAITPRNEKEKGVKS